MIETKRLLTLFEALVSFDSPSFGEREIGDFVRQRLHALGADVTEDDAAAAIGGTCGNLYAYAEGTLPLPPLLFCAHLDTVEPARGKRMQLAADGTITSAGDTVLGADDCAGIAAILEALTALKASGRPHRPIELLFTVAEEPYCRGAQVFNCAQLHAKEAYVFDLSGPVGSAAYQAPTILSFTAVFTGRAAHAGFAPEDGVHAIRAAAHAVAAVPCGRIAAGTTLNFGTVSGGTANNIVPDRCELTGEIRSDSDESALALLSEITRTMRQQAEMLGAGVSVTHTVHISGYRTDPAGPAAERFRAACQVLSLPCSLQATFGGSDNNRLAQQGIEGLVVANAMERCHSVNEYTSTEELRRAAELALELMCSTR